MNFDQPFFKRNFIGQEYIVHDTSTNSPYIDFPDMPTYIGGGVSIVKYYPSTVNLHTLAPLEAEVLDTNGNVVRTEIADYRDRFGNYYLSIYTSDSTAEGYGSISFVGVANATLDGKYIGPNEVNAQGYNLIITKPLLIQPFERNSSPLVFDQPPVVNVAQITAPARISTSDGSQTTTLTRRFTASFTTANVEGFDKVSATSANIQDNIIRDFAIKNTGQSSTTNQVATTVRQNDSDIENGQLINDTNRFRTILQLSGSALSSSYKGAQITLNKYNTYTNVTESLSSTTVFAKTNPYNGYNLPGQTQSLNTQLEQYKGTVVRVLNTSSCIVDIPLQVNIDTYSNARKNPIMQVATHTFRSVKNVGIKLDYQNPTTIIASSNISQSYLQFTFQSLKPIGGNVYRIKSFYRQNSLTGDYQLLNDQRVVNTEYLTEAKELNTLYYARETTPFRLIGHFSDSSSLQYWKGYTETATAIDTIAVSNDQDVLIDSVKLPTSSPSASTVLTTAAYQIYQQGQVFSFSFICVLEPNTTLEVYANSKLISTQLYDASPFAQAFATSKNSEKTRYSSNDNRFGKYVGKIVNNTNKRKDYGRVIFDVNADGEGYGRPLFRVKATDGSTAGSTAYLSEISVTPRLRNGYTPEIYQYTINAPNGFEQLVSESVDFKFEYYDYTGNQSEFVTYINSINLSLNSEIQSNICRVENYKFLFNPTIWAIVSESATYRNTFIAPYGGFSSIAGTSSAQYTNPSAFANADNPTQSIGVSGYNTHSFAQIGQLLSPSSNTYPNQGWGSTKANSLLLYVTSSNLGTNRGRRYYPAYDQMHAQLSFYDAYSSPISSESVSSNAKTYSYGIGSTWRYTTPANPTQDQVHRWSGWNALRPWKPILANRQLNKTREADIANGLYDGRFIYTASWEIFPNLGQGVYVQPTTNAYYLNATSVSPTVIKYNNPIVGATVTASWKFFDEFSENYVQVSGSAARIGSIPASASTWSPHTASFNRSIISASYVPRPGLGTSSMDRNFPVNSGAAGITRFDVSQSYATTSGAGFTTAQKARAYKQRRFYFPQGGFMTSSVFTENGGIYNVKFRLKRYQSGSNSLNWFSPDTGSYLMAYIFNVSTAYTAATTGTAGYYPPPQNIIKIGNQVTANGYNIPPIQFYDSATGYLYDEYEVNLIQYGTPGQLVFEPSGDGGAYFGCAIDSVEFCKIGTTTDPYYIKPPADDTI